MGVAFFGDGAVGNGAFHEGLNLAAIWDLPVLFVCENNLYATEVAFDYAARNTDVAGRAGGYGMPGECVDGNDALAVYAAAGEAVERARGGGGPSLLECRTYRTRPHAEGMGDGGYRSREEIDRWRQRDPIPLLAHALLDGSAATADDLEAVAAEVDAEIAEAAAFAEASPWPDPATVSDHVYGRGS